MQKSKVKGRESTHERGESTHERCEVAIRRRKRRHTTADLSRETRRGAGPLGVRFSSLSLSTSSLFSVCFFLSLRLSVCLSLCLCLCLSLCLARLGKYSAINDTPVSYSSGPYRSSCSFIGDTITALLHENSWPLTWGGEERRGEERRGKQRDD